MIGCKTVEKNCACIWVMLFLLKNFCQMHDTQNIHKIYPKSSEL